ncbi:MAG: family 16 glycosylhydrolase [Fibrobacteres bacterium]|jgi:endo-1,3-1,4-beta-glycanase ExoK|nr:family 16 glycosylhydrolase [Fibrobacterota bacterium]
MLRTLYIGLTLGQVALAAGAAGAAALDGAEFYSNETVKFGRWEMRMRMAATPGSVSSFFTYYNNSSKGSPEPWREIDIEVIGKNPNGFQSNLITGNAASRTTSEAFQTSSDVSKEFHTYTLDWTPDSIVYRMDGQTVRKNLATDPQVKDLSDMPETYRMNLWASTAADWAGAMDPAKLPVTQTVNWIAYSAYTPGQGPNGSNFTPKWVDDFNSLDTQRWSRGNWTFDGNMADFTPNNAVVSGGYLMLILSKKGWSGNLTPPADPLGNVHTTSIAAPTEAAPFRMEATAGRLRVFGGDKPAEVSVSDLQGRILARSRNPGWMQFDNLPHGLLIVRSAEGSRLVPMP